MSKQIEISLNIIQEYSRSFASSFSGLFGRFAQTLCEFFHQELLIAKIINKKLWWFRILCLGSSWVICLISYWWTDLLFWWLVIGGWWVSLILKYFLSIVTSLTFVILCHLMFRLLFCLIFYQWTNHIFWLLVIGEFSQSWNTVYTWQSHIISESSYYFMFRSLFNNFLLTYLSVLCLCIR